MWLTWKWLYMKISYYIYLYEIFFCESTIDHVKLTSKLDASLTKHRHSIHKYNKIQYLFIYFFI